jgi:hypothetical protein
VIFILADVCEFTAVVLDALVIAVVDCEEMVPVVIDGWVEITA